MGERGNLREIRDETQRLLDRIDTKLIERQERQSLQQRERVFSRLVRGSVVVGALVAAWRWIRDRRASEIITVGAMGALGAMLAVGPPDLDEQQPEQIPEAHGPWPWDVMPIIDRSMMSPQAAATAMVTPMPEPEPPIEPGEQTEPEPQESEQAQPALTEPSAAPPEPEPVQPPQDEPQTEPTSEPPVLNDVEDARQLCLDLDERPVVGLGACIRHLLGIE